MALAFTIPAATLQGLVALCGKFVERRNTIPILSNLLIEVEAGGRVAVTATDLDVWASASSPEATATVTTAGSTTLPAHLLSDILRKLPKDATVAIDVTDGEPQAKVKSGRSAFRLAHLPAEDLPNPPGHVRDGQVFDETAFEMTAFAVKRLVDTTSFAISKEETRYYLNGVCLHGGEPEAELLTAVATDGHRLSLLKIATHGDTSGLPRIIVPSKTVKIGFPLVAESAAEDERVRITASKHIIVLETDRLRLVSKLIEGTFPDYERVIPRGNDRLMRVDPAALAASVDRVSTVSSERGRAVKFVFTEGGALELVVNSPDAGTAREDMSVGTEDLELEIGFNAAYVGEALGTFFGEVEIALADAGSPALIRHHGDDTRLVVLMPMRV